MIQVFTLCFMLTFTAFSSTIKSASSGVWGTAATWQGGVVPKNNDTVEVLAGHTIAIDTNYTIHKLTVDGNGVLLFDGKANRTLSVIRDVTIAANGKITPSAAFSTGDAYNTLRIGGNLTVDGAIEYQVKGSTSGDRLMQQIYMEYFSTEGNVFIKGKGTIESRYLSVNKFSSNDTVKINPGITITTGYVYIYKGTLDNTKNNVSTYTCTRFDNVSKFMALANYRSADKNVAYLGSTDITTDIELPDTVYFFTNQNPAKFVTLHKDIVVKGSLLLSDGRINTGKYTVKLNGTILNSGYIQKGFVMGNLEKPISTKADSIKTFEVGGTNGYAEVNLKFYKLTPKGSLVVNSRELMHKKIIDTMYALKRYWSFMLKDSVLFSECEITLRYTSKDFVNGLNEAKDETKLIVAYYETNAKKWIYPKIVKTDTSGAGGTITVSGITTLYDFVIIRDEKALAVQSEKYQPTTIELLQNYPNPFNPTTTINYELPVNNYVSIKVYDGVGREVATLVNEKKEAGRYSVEFNASKLSSGVYFYKLQVGNYSTSKKLLLLR